MTLAVSKVLSSTRQLWPVEQWQNVNVAVALSGGADSVALLRTIVTLKQQFGGRGTVSVIHINHQLRGEDSEADAAWCKQTCEELGVPLTICLAETTTRAERDGDGIEAAARAERYRLLTVSAEAAGARYLATAHTADDQVETVLMRILRGTGVRGLAGMPRLRKLTPSLTLVRPLLASSRADVEAMLAELGQAYRTDQSNRDESFTRNRVRHQLLPLLREQFNEDISETLLRLAFHAGQTQQFFDATSSDLLAKCDTQIGEGEASLNLTSLRDIQPLLRSETLRTFWRDLKLPEQAMTHDSWEQLANLCIEPEVLNLPGNIRAEVVDDRLRLSW